MSTPLQPWQDQIAAKDLGQHLQRVAEIVAGDWSAFSYVRERLDEALRLPGKILDSSVARGEPLQMEDHRLWSLHVMLSYATTSRADLAGSWAPCEPVAAMGELVGLAFDVSDDLQDEDGAFFLTHGTAATLSVTMALLTQAHTVLEDARIPIAYRADLHAMLHRAILGSVEGQLRDALFEQRESVSLSESQQMTELKSGSLIGLLYQAGAFVGAASRLDLDVARKLSIDFLQLGSLIGARLQYENDLRDAQPDSLKSDRKRKKKTLPLVAEYMAQSSQGGGATSLDITLITIEALRQKAQSLFTQITREYQISDRWLHWIVGKE